MVWMAGAIDVAGNLEQVMAEDGYTVPAGVGDEIKLIVVGGCLGALVGFAQYILLFSGGI